MEPITIIVTALALGAAAGLKPTAEQAVKDTYTGLKTLIQRKFEKVDLDLLEAKPDSKTRQAVVEEELQEVDADKDTEILQQAKVLLDAVEDKAPEAAATVGVSLKDIKGASLQLNRIIVNSSGQGSTTGVSIEGADIQGDISISDVNVTHNTGQNITGDVHGNVYSGNIGQVGDRYINTGGGSYIEGNAQAGEDFVGRDKNAKDK